MNANQATLLLVATGALATVACSRASGEHGGTGAPNPSARVVPVVTTPVARRDVPIYLEGLGTVAAYKTVTVKTQVDGRLDKVLFREGQAVKTGEVLAQIDPRPFEIQLHQAEGALGRDQALLRSAQLNLARYQELRTKQLVPQQQVDDQAALVGQYQGAVAIDEAQVSSAKLNLDYARIKSPLDGVTGVRQVDPGNIVHQADQTGIVLLTQLDPIAVLFTLPQDDLPRVTQALAAGPLPVEAYARDGVTKLGEGQLALVDNQINEQTATMRLKAIFPNPKRALWPNAFVKARLLVTVRKQALVLPAAAPQRGPKGTFVYVVGADQTVEPKPVEIVETQGDVVVIGETLQPGEVVVVDGQNQLRPGSKVAARPATDRTDKSEMKDKADKAEKTEKTEKPVNREQATGNR